MSVRFCRRQQSTFSEHSSTAMVDSQMYIPDTEIRDGFLLGQDFRQTSFSVIDDFCVSKINMCNICLGISTPVNGRGDLVTAE